MSNSRNVPYNRNGNSYRKEPVNSEKLASYLKDVVQKVRLQEDPAVLNEYRKVFKQNVPFTMRMYVASYLASQAVPKGGRDFKSSRENRDFRESRDFKENRDFRENRKSEKEDASFESHEERPRAPRVIIPEDQSVTIFVGIGKNRHVKPKDLVGLISQVCEISRDRIGLIRTLDKYSFVTLYSDDADKVIEKLNGIEYRGKNIEVSYSRKRSASDETTIDEQNEVAENENEDENDDAISTSSDVSSGSEAENL